MENQNQLTLASTRTVFKNAYEALAAEISAVPVEQLIPINVDVDGAVITARGAMPEILGQREAMRRELQQFDTQIVDKLEQYALALFHLNAQYRMATAPSLELPALAEQATAMRDMFVADAKALSTRGLVDRAAVEGRPQGQGYKLLVAELYAVMDLLRGAWNRIESRSAVRPEEFAEAESLADRISLGIGLREQGPSVSTSAITLERQRAFTLFARKYDQVRRAIQYLRWEQGDIDSIAPSLYAGRNNGGRKPKETPRSDVAQQATATQPNAAWSNAAQPASVGAAASPLGPEHAAPSMAALAPGFPGSDPFAPA